MNTITNKELFSRLMKYINPKLFFLLIVITITSLLTVGNFTDISFLRNFKMTLGLDLQGGNDILLQVDTNEYITNYKKNLVREIQKEMYRQEIGYKNFEITNDNFSFELRNSNDAKKVKKILKGLNVSFLEKNAKFESNLNDDVIKDLKKKVVEQSIEVIRKRVDELGNKEIILYAIDDDKISLQIPGKNDQNSIAKLLNTQAKLTFHLMDENPFVTNKNIQTQPNVEILEGMNSGVYYFAVNKEVIIDGADLEDARAIITENGEAAVSFAFNQKASIIFADVTMQNIGRPFAIILDDKVLSAPNIKEPIVGGKGVISGSFTTKEANELALFLRAGALPAKIEILSQRNISATLGYDSIILGIKSMIAGVIMLSVYILWRYKLLGVFAMISLMVNVLCIVSFLSLLNSTLTFPGIAGIILTMGMAVDGNIIIYENIFSFRRKYKDRNITMEAFERSKAPILDSNLTTLLSAIILYQFGFGPIRGFALTLAIGVIFSVFSSLFVTKTLLEIKK